MKAILGILKNRWVLAALGLIAIALLIFFLGPLFGFADSRPLQSVAARLITILVIVLVWLAVQVVRLLRASRASKQLAEGIVEADAAAEPEPDRSAEEVEALRERFEEAVSVLKKSPGAEGRGLYDLPWYIIIGPPGSGKTTALVNSGLRFPLSERFGKEALRGVGGTRNCDWWFTDEAILLDTAGRYTTQDSHADTDRSAWRGFLDLLKKYRRRRPINGVLVAISLSDLMMLSDQERHNHAVAIKERIQELDKHFGIRFPVYLMFTKCDLVAGFMEFFDDLDRTGREQVWGTTFPLDDTPGDVPVERFAAEFDGLIERLDERLLERLSNERDLRRRNLIYGFARQMASLKHTLNGFLETIFRGSRFEQTPMLRGVYFTSGTQEGAPIDRLMGTIARTFGLDQQALPTFAGQGRSYFITSLLRRVVFNESEIAGTNRKLEGRRAWLQRAAYAAVFVLFAGLLAGWGASYFNNLKYLDRVAESVPAANAEIQSIPERGRDVVEVLPALNAVRDLPGGYAGRDAGTPFLHGLGLYQGDKVGKQASEAYRRVLEGQLLPRILLRIEQQIDQTGVPLDYTYEALKTYLRFASEEHYSAEDIGAWVTLDWDNTLHREIGSERLNELKEHLAALLEVQATPLPIPLDRAVVARARQRLQQVPMEERVYARLKYSNLDKELADFNILDAAGQDAALVFTRVSGKPLSEGIPGLFTKPGYRMLFTDMNNLQVLRELSAEEWVLRDDVELSELGNLAALFANVRELYLDDYADQYEALVADVQLAPFADASEAARILDVLSRPDDSPLLLLALAIREQTTLDDSAPAATANDESAEADDDAYRKQRERLEAVLGGQVSEPEIVRAGRTYATVVDERFADLNKLVEGERGAMPIQHLMGLLRELQDFMMTVANEETASGLPKHVADQGRTTLRKVQFEADRQKSPVVKEVLAGAASGSANIAFGGVTTQIDAQWRSGPLSFCQQAIAGRYPVDPGSSREIRLEDFGRFFGYGGLMETFFNDYLKDLIDTSRRPWELKSAGGDGVQLAPGAVAQFERAHRIKETFFRGDSAPFVGFDLSPVSMDAAVTQFTLVVDGQTARYSHGPRTTDSFEWPGPNGTGEVRIEMAPAGTQALRQERGPWAWFRVLDDSNISPAERPEHFNVTFSLGGRSATYELVARSAFNPFQSTALTRFACPESLTR